MTTHPIDTEALRRLADAATPGPWNAHPAGKYVWTEDLGGIIQNWSEDANAVADMDFIAAARTAVPALLDQLAAAEHRATRAEAQSAIRGRAVQIYQHRARTAEAERDQERKWRLELDAAHDEEIENAEKAEARIKAVEEVLDRAHEEFENPDEADIRRALDGTVTPPAE